MPTWNAAGRCMSSAGRLKKLKSAWKELGLDTRSLLSHTDQGVRNSFTCGNLSYYMLAFVFLQWHLVFMVAHAFSSRP